LVEPLFDLSASFGVPGALNKFFNSFSQLSVNPNDVVARQGVLDAAGQTAQAFRQTALGITQASMNADHQIRDTVASITRLATTIAALNKNYRENSEATQDAGLDAQMHSAFEELSGLANYTLIRTDDGGFNVYLGGQTPLVVGDHEFPIQAGYSNSQTAILDWQGNDITAQITRGSLGALLQEKNATLPGYQPDLNTLAQHLADSVNATLAQGVDSNGQTPAVGLFTYNAATDASSSIAVTGITTDQIAAATAAAPGGNGNAIAMVQLSKSPALNGFTFTEYFGNLGARVGHDVAVAQQDGEHYADAVAYAQQQRQSATGVSLDEEAAKMLQFQQAYQAVSKMITTIDQLTQELMDAKR